MLLEGTDMDTANTAPIERIARVLAGHELSRNAEGDMRSAGDAVDGLWPDYADAALAASRRFASQAHAWQRPETLRSGSE
jgi:hypothetical protein